MQRHGIPTTCENTWVPAKGSLKSCRACRAKLPRHLAARGVYLCRSCIIASLEAFAEC